MEIRKIKNVPAKAKTALAGFSPKKNPKKAGAAVGIAAILVFLAAFTFSGTPVETAKAETGRAEDFYVEDGVLTGTGNHNIIAESSGEVAEILVKENDEVKAGDALIRLDTADYERQLRALRAKRTQVAVGQVTGSSPAEYVAGLPEQTEAAKAAYQAAKTAYDAGDALYRDGSISYMEYQKIKSDYETAKAAYDAASTRLSESRSAMKQNGLGSSTIGKTYYSSERDIIDVQIEQLEEDIENCTIKADADGVVTSIPVKEQSAVAAGEVAACISGKALATVEADVLTSAAPYVKPGTKCKVTLRLRGKDITAAGKVTERYDYADEGTSSLGLSEYRVHVKAAINAESAADFAEMTGYGVEIKFCVFEKENALKVPSSAVFSDGDGDFVYLAKGGKAVKTAVEVEYKAGDTAVILSGIKEGDKVVKSADSEDVFDGARIRAK